MVNTMNQNNSSYRKKGEISLEDIFSIIIRRKAILISFVVLALIAAVLYNYFKTPVYEATTLLKKEQITRNPFSTQMSDLLLMQPQEEIETDMELVKTRKVLHKVINNLYLNIFVKEIVIPDDKNITVNKNYLNVATMVNDEDSVVQCLPAFKNLQTNYIKKKESYVLRKIEGGLYELENLGTKTIYRSDTLGNISSPLISFKVDWNQAKWGCEFYFDLESTSKVLKDLSDRISVNKRIKTNLFEISAKATTPLAAKILANTVANSYTSTKIEQQKENIRHSFKFVDNQLQEISKKLEQAQKQLTDFKAQNKILSIDESSKKLIEFVSNLESEKLKTEIELATYENKLNDMKNEMKAKGYIDQTYLTPNSFQPSDSPFSRLLSQLSDLELQKIQLLQKRTENHPDVITLTNKINSIRRNLSKFNGNTLTAYNIIIDALKSKKHKIENLISNYLTKIENLPVQENKLANLMRQKNVYAKMFTLLLDKREEMRMAELSKLQDIIILDYAEEPLKPILPNKKLNLIAALLFGFVLGMFALFIYEFNDKKLSDVYEIEKDFHYPILSVIPTYTKEIKETVKESGSITKRFVALIEGAFNYKEAYRILETKASNCMASSNSKYLMVTSPEENTGKTTTVGNLALTMARSEKKVLVIDCDIRKPKIAELFGMEKYAPGLVNFLQGETEKPNIYKPIKITGHESILRNIDILPSGTFSDISGEIFGSEKMKELLDELDYYDVIIFDTPPITRIADALSLGKFVKNALLVIRPGVTYKESVNWAASELKVANVKLCGLVVNDSKVKKSIPRYQYGYNS